jgi:hypothetical protein
MLRTDVFKENVSPKTTIIGEFTFIGKSVYYGTEEIFADLNGDPYVIDNHIVFKGRFGNIEVISPDGIKIKFDLRCALNSKYLLCQSFQEARDNRIIYMDSSGQQITSEPQFTYQGRNYGGKGPSWGGYISVFSISSIEFVQSDPYKNSPYSDFLNIKMKATLICDIPMYSTEPFMSLSTSNMLALNYRIKRDGDYTTAVEFYEITESELVTQAHTKDITFELTGCKQLSVFVDAHLDGFISNDYIKDGTEICNKEYVEKLTLTEDDKIYHIVENVILLMSASKTSEYCFSLIDLDTGYTQDIIHLLRQPGHIVSNWYTLKIDGNLRVVSQSTVMERAIKLRRSRYVDNFISIYRMDPKDRGDIRDVPETLIDKIITYTI